MSDSPGYQVRKVFIASPSDLVEERSMFPQILEQVNRIKAHDLGLHLEPLDSESSPPGMGRPQGLIDETVKECDLFVMLLWKRWGTPSGKYSSGTEEEFELARRRARRHKKPTVWLYFRDVPQEMIADPGEQLRRVLNFRDKVEAENVCKYERYGSASEWERLFEDHLCAWVAGRPQAIRRKGAFETTPEITQQLDQLSEQARTTPDAVLKALRLATIRLAQSAIRAARDGRVTQAEEDFAVALRACPEPHVLYLHGLFLMQLCRFGEAVKRFSQVRKAACEASELGLATKACINLGLAYQQRGELQTAEAIYRKALDLNEKSGEQPIPSIHRFLGVLCRTMGRLDDAEELFRKAVAMDEYLGYKAGMASDYCNLGILYRTKGDLEAAEKMFRKALPLETDAQGLASDYYNLGILYRSKGNLDAAKRMHRKALALDTRLSYREGMARDYCDLGIVCRIRGDLDAAEEKFRKALAIEEALGHKEGIASNLRFLGHTYKSKGDFERAEKMYREALALNRQLGNKLGIASDLRNLGSVYRDKGDLDVAEQMYLEALVLDQETSHQVGLARCYCSLSSIHRIRGDLQRAEEACLRALYIDEKVGQVEGMATDLSYLGNIYEHDGRLEVAEDVYRRALQLHERLGHREALASDYLNLGSLFRVRGDLASAADMLRRSVDLSRSLGLRPITEKAEGLLAELDAPR